jgi:Cu(I)/Ag(I) efflux system membrane fusion protein
VNASNVPNAPEPAPRGARFMNALRWTLFAALAVLAVAAIAGYFFSRAAGPAGHAASRTADVYYCPMHPNVTSDRPGECPICGMTLEKRAPAAADAEHAGHGASDVPGLTAVRLDPERVQMIGVRTAIAERRGLGGERELVGFVTPDESRLSRVQLRVSGWVESLAAGNVGDRVAQDEPLLTLYSPELFQSESEFLIATGARDSTMHAHLAGLAGASRERLQSLGVPAQEIARLERTREASKRVTIRSPIAGTVIERGVSEGQYVGPDTPLLALADLSRVWVLADVYEQDLGDVRTGRPARFTSDALPGREYEGRVDFVYPTVSTESRTVKARIALANADGALKPGMYGRVRIAGATGSRSLVVPGEAVVSAGDKRYVFIAHAGGRFEPRLVVVGREQGDTAEILSGLAPGDTVVASGSFLIDSESRLESAISGVGAESGAHEHGAGK